MTGFGRGQRARSRRRGPVCVKSLPTPTPLSLARMTLRRCANASPLTEPRPAARIESQRQGIVRELYISSMMQAAADAHSQGKKLSMIAGECTWSSERAWNSVGRRRVYVETGPNEYSEL